MRHLISVRIQGAGEDGMSRQRLECQRSYKLRGRLRHDDVNILTGFRKQAQEFHRFVSGDAAGDA